MSEVSILYLNPSASQDSSVDPPACFHDLNLDVVVAAITAGREKYGLASHFHTPLHTPDEMLYRHEVFRDLEKPETSGIVRAFAEKMRVTRTQLTRVEEVNGVREKDRWFLNAAHTYCKAVDELAGGIAVAGVQSRGLCQFSDYLARHVGSESFREMAEHAQQLFSDVSSLIYNIRVKGLKVTVYRHHDELDYGALVERMFHKFRQGEVEDYLLDLGERGSPNSVEHRILECVAALYPDLFSAIGTFRHAHASFVDDVIARFDSEVQFYLAYEDYLQRIRPMGLEFCYPTLREGEIRDYCVDSFDLALAFAMRGQELRPVCNDFSLEGEERIIVVSGPNQGGKTTFARMIGQVYYLASIGCPVPGREAALTPADCVHTHFERQERVEDLRSKLEDDMLRVKEVLQSATDQSVIVMNEVFSSATLEDAIYLGQKVFAEISRRRIRSVCVTFVDELARFDVRTVSMVAGVDEHDVTKRTFKLSRRPADGRAFAVSLASKYGLIRDDVAEEVRT